MKKNKKIFFLSIIIFLFMSGSISIFFMMKGIEDLKGRPGLSFEYSSYPKKAFFPILKSLGIIDEENIDYNSGKSLAKKLSKILKDSLFPSSEENINKEENNNLNKNSNNKKNQTYYPNSKLNAKGQALPNSSGSSKTDSKLTNFSKGVDNKEAIVGNKFDDKGSNSLNSKKLLARLEATGDTIKEGLRSGSAMQARYKWDQSFVGSLGPKNKMIYGKNAVKLDSIRGELVNLKAGETKGLHINAPTSPEVDNPKNEKVEKLKDDISKKLKEGMAQSMMSSAFSPPNTNQSEEETSLDDKMNSKLDEEISKWEIPGETIQKLDISCETSSVPCPAGVTGTIKAAYFPVDNSYVAVFMMNGEMKTETGFIPPLN